MINFLKEHTQILVLLLFWLFAGMLFAESSYLLIPLSLIFLRKKQLYTYMIVGFLMIIFFADNRHHMLGDWAFNIKDVYLVVLSIFVFLNMKEFPDRGKLFTPFIVFLLFAFLLTIRSIDPLMSFQRTLSYTLILAATPGYFMKELDRFGVFLPRTCIWFCILFLTVSLIMILFFNSWVYTNGRFNGLLGSPNGIGTLGALLIILIAVSKYHYPDIFSKSEYFFIYGIIIASVIISSSRNSLFSILIFLFFLRFYKISYFYGFIIVIISAIVFQFINENLVSIITSLGLGKYLRVEHLDDGSGRLIAWSFAWQEIERHFFIGQGFGYDKDYFTINREYLSSLGHQGGVHNTYLTFWLNTGLIGLVLFLVAFVRLFVKAASINYIAIPTLFTILFTISFESWAAASLSPFFLLLLLIITLLQYQKNEPVTQKDIIPLQ